MDQVNDGTEKDSSLINDALELLQNEDVDISFENVKNLIQFSPYVKELFTKATELSQSSGQNVFDVIKEVISVYEEELKREDLTYDQRVNIYDRIDKHAMNAMKQDDSNKKFIAGVTGVLLTSLVGGAVKFGPRIIKSVIKK